MRHNVKVVIFAAAGIIAVVSMGLIAIFTNLPFSGTSAQGNVPKSSPTPKTSPKTDPQTEAKTAHRFHRPGHKLPTSITSATNPYKPTVASGGPGQTSIAQPGPGVTLCAGPSGSRLKRITYGINEVFDNAWLGYMCIESAGPGYFRVTRGLPAKGDGVVEAYPDVWTGTHYFHHTPGSFLPMPVSQVMNSSISTSARWSFPKVRSVFLADYDAWAFASGADLRGHGDAEIVIVVNSVHTPGTLVRIEGHLWREKTWLTCSRLTSGGCDPSQPEWPILMFAATRNIMNPQLSIAPFFRRLVDQGYLARSQVLGSLHFGFECWTGCVGAAALAQFSG